MWENILILGVRVFVEADKKPRLKIYGKNEEGSRREWMVFSNKLGEGDDTIYILSDHLHLALAACVDKMSNLYTKYVQAMKDNDKDAFLETERKLFKVIADPAEELHKIDQLRLQKLKEGNVKDSLKEMEERGKNVSDQISKYIAGHIIRIDWELSERDGGTAKFGGPAKHPACMRKSKLDGSSTFGDLDVKEVVESFKDSSGSQGPDPEKQLQLGREAMLQDMEDEGSEDDFPV